MRRDQMLAERLGELLVGRAAAERGAEIVAAGREEARVEAALRREARPRAGAAERLRDGGDHADLAGAVGVAEAARRRVGALGGDGLERPALADPLDDLVRRDDVLEPPAVRRADVHELDEAEDVARAAEMIGERDDVGIVRCRA